MLSLFRSRLKGDKWWGATAVSGPEESRSPTEARNEQLFGLTAGINKILLDNPDVTMTKPYEAASSLTHQVAFICGKGVFFVSYTLKK